ncbi:TolB family protein, partial [Salegentibacter sp.]|uniref:TolB family protein n=1 Tax=Salegentibacter sp. TaxID=1903072 RepID=UPI003569627B
MKKLYIFLILSGIFLSANAQTMTPEKLWELERVSPIGLTDDGQQVIYSSTSYDISTNSSNSKTFVLSLKGGEPTQINSYDSIYTDTKVSPSGEYKIISKEVKVEPVSGEDFYPEMEESDVYIYDDLNYRHWDTWEDGKYSHLFIKDLSSEEEWDIMKGEPHDTPLKPFGGSEDYIWNNDGTKVFYVSKKLKGKDYAESTNSDIYSYDLTSKTTTNLTENNEGYDTSPAISRDGTLAWLQMDEPGYETDKNDIIVLRDGQKQNLTKDWDETVSSFLWSEDGEKLFFVAPTMGTKQLFEVSLPKEGSGEVKQITEGQFDITGMVGEADN